MLEKTEGVLSMLHLEDDQREAHLHFMQEALVLAEQAAAIGEVPIGARSLSKRDKSLAGASIAKKLKKHRSVMRN